MGVATRSNVIYSPCATVSAWRWRWYGRVYPSSKRSSREWSVNGDNSQEEATRRKESGTDLR